jgi:glutathione S-transferase
MSSSFKSRAVVVKKPEDIPAEPVDSKPTLVYWAICGLAGAIRLALVLGRADFVDVRIDAGEASDPGYKKNWFVRKPALQEYMAFPNLPYFMDTNGVYLTQSNAILKYIGRKYDLIGNKEHVVDMILDQLTDFDASFTRLAYPSTTTMNDLQQWCESFVPDKLSQWERLLGNQEYLTGDTPTIADVKFYESLRRISVVQKEVCNDNGGISGFPKLQDYMKSIEAIPSIKAYMDSDDFLQRPLNNPHAFFH